jgi:hypothetical protein
MFTFIPSALAEDAAAENAPSWFETAFEKFGEFPVWGWIIVAVLLIGGFAAYRLLKGEHKTVWNAPHDGSGRAVHGAELRAEHDPPVADAAGGSVYPGQHAAADAVRLCVRRGSRRGAGRVVRRAAVHPEPVDRQHASGAAGLPRCLWHAGLGGLVRPHEK